MASAYGIVMNKQYYVHNKEAQIKINVKSMKNSMKYEMWQKKKKNFTCSAVEETCNIGSMVKNGLIYRQNLMIRSSEIGFNGKLSINALMTYLQDTALNHGRRVGLGQDLGITTQMYQRNLIWVLSSLQLVVDHYPSWLDVVEIETWMYPSGQNGLSHDWIIRDGSNGHSVARASSVFVLMNKETRKLSKFIKEVREELSPYLMNSKSIIDNPTPKLPKIDMHSASFTRAGLKPGWTDLDVNQHVNNARYINWMLESVPQSLIENHELLVINLKYLRECNIDNELHSLSNIVTKSDANVKNHTIELEHLLCFDKGPEIAGGCTIWKPNNFS
ncbi:Palmitoyl-acyl carrier protein thioesterase chloroplastic [Euphorbia peplus]|nr:Palmitoyl-acyl carrier protein thioesterase chloroplastic [Euphorbia peplus]